MDHLPETYDNDYSNHYNSLSAKVNYVSNSTYTDYILLKCVFLHSL